jgi:hypothetical protein
VNRDVLIKFISTNDQVVDVFTNGLTSSRFLSLKCKLRVVPPPISLQGVIKENQYGKFLKETTTHALGYPRRKDS